MLKKSRPEKSVLPDIMLTLLVLELMAYFYYGVRSLVLAGACVGSSLIAEIISVRLMGRSFRVQDFNCISDALIISLMMPAVADFKIAGLAGVFAVVVAKNVFGGRFNMIFSPPAVAYVFMLASWKNDLLQFTEPHVKTGLLETPEKLVDSFSHVYNITGKVSSTDFEILLGNFTGASGAVSILLLIVSAVILILRRDISAGAFIGTVSGTAVFAVITSMSVKYSLVTNMVLFSAVYIISDRRIAPANSFYAFFYGFFIAMFAYILVVTTAKENAIVMVSVLFTPVAVAFRNLERRIEKISEEGERIGQQE
ncbi:MAG: RnfABCDGE type electron transport complex subunit D [Ruminococcus flavefaciens]|nr:RnfABCDGE type electron transport complex subunit D [Ruminococcus flavefaciens]